MCIVDVFIDWGINEVEKRNDEDKNNDNNYGNKN